MLPIFSNERFSSSNSSSSFTRPQEIEANTPKEFGLRTGSGLTSSWPKMAAIHPGSDGTIICMFQL
jgi:hypothetical protein